MGFGIGIHGLNAGRNSVDKTRLGSEDGERAKVHPADRNEAEFKASYVVELKSVEECNINAPHSQLRSTANKDLVKD